MAMSHSYWRDVIGANREKLAKGGRRENSYTKTIVNSERNGAKSFSRRHSAASAIHEDSSRVIGLKGEGRPSRTNNKCHNVEIKVFRLRAPPSDAPCGAFGAWRGTSCFICLGVVDYCTMMQYKRCVTKKGNASRFSTCRDDFTTLAK